MFFLSGSEKEISHEPFPEYSTAPVFEKRLT